MGVALEDLVRKLSISNTYAEASDLLKGSEGPDND